jgi:glycine/D-amino acid oxidase-like deaminating enzyme
MIDRTKAEIVICGAGIAGVAAAYHLTVRQGFKRVILVDPRPPLTLTSDKSTECYRNWWPGPGDTMVRFMNRSIDLLEALSRESDNYFHMNRRGYIFLTADPDRAVQFREQSTAITQLGAGELRIHDGHSAGSTYPPLVAHGVDPMLNGADLVLDPALIQARYPFLAKDTVALLHPRRCGWLSAQQLGMYLLQRAKAHGAQLLNGHVSGVNTVHDRIHSIQVQTANGPDEIETQAFIIAAGPLLKSVASLIGIDVPVFNELHGKIAIEDPLGIVPRDLPLMIWNDPITLPWSEAETKELARDEHMRWLTEPFPPGVHFRPEGGPEAKTLLMLWTYHLEAMEPVWPLPPFEPEYPEIVMRGLSRMIPDLSVYFDRMSKPEVDGGYYCKTQENRPLIGPLPVEGAYVIGALSGFGIMASMAAGELLAAHVAGGELPDYATAFLLSRYEDPEYQKLLAGWDATSGQL